MGNSKSKKIERLFSIFRSLFNTDFDKTKYEHRLILQKIAYIVKITDKTLSYSFSWYIRGPYSPKLTQDEFDFNNPENMKISEKDKDNVNFLKEMLGEINNDNAKLSLELFASVYYIMINRNTRDFDVVNHAISVTKPWFEEKDIRKIFNKIISSGILN